MIDISKSKSPLQKNKSYSKTNILLLISLFWVIYDTQYWTKFIPDRIEPSSSLSQVLFVIDDTISVAQGQASLSVKVDKFCDEAGIEKRRLETNQDVSKAELWLQDMSQLGYSQSPCIVFRKQSGKLHSVPIPEGIDLTIQKIQEQM